MRNLKEILSYLVLGFIIASFALRDQVFLGSFYYLTRPVLIFGFLMLSIFYFRKHQIFHGICWGVFLAMLVGEYWQTKPAGSHFIPSAESKTIKILTYNLMFRGGSPQLSIEVIKEVNADVLFLQEVTSRLSGLVEAELTQYSHRWLMPQEGVHGQAILSKFPIQRGAVLENRRNRPFSQCGKIELSKLLAFCHVHLDGPAGVLHLDHAFLQNYANNYAMKVGQFFKAEQEVLKSAGPTDIAMLIGDFNSLEFEPFFAKARSRWVDAFRSTRLFSFGFTYPNLPKEKDPIGFGPVVRIDYLLLKGNVKVKGAELSVRSGSDHLPLITEVIL